MKNIILIWVSAAFWILFLLCPPSDVHKKKVTPHYNTEKHFEETFSLYDRIDIPDLNNADFIQNFSMPKFDIADTNEIENYRGLLKWVPENWGYSEEEALKIFPE